MFSAEGIQSVYTLYKLNCKNQALQFIDNQQNRHF